MKSFIKLTTAALALVTLASCSNDDLLGNSNSIAGKKTLELNVEQMKGEATTRTAYVGTNNARVWQDQTDIFTVYDDEMHKYDFYKFDEASNKFVLDGKSDLTEPKFLLFPKENVVTTRWEKETNSVYGTIRIPTTIDYSQVEGSDPTVYISNLPLWGTAEKDGDGIQGEASFLTSILKITLTKALNNCAAISVFAYDDIEGNTEKNISGEAEVQLSKNGEPFAPDQAVLKTPEYGNNYITVYIDNDDILTENSVIYVPIVAGYYGMIKVKAYTDASEATNPSKGTIINTSSTKGKDYTYVNKDFKRATPYAGAKKEFDVNASTVAMLNEQIANCAESAGEVVIDGSKTATTATVSTDDVVVVPAMKATELTLKLDNITGTGVTFTGDYAGKLVLNVKSAQSQAIDFNMPKATIQLVRTYSTNLTFSKAAGVIFGDGETPTTASTGTNTFKAAAAGTIEVMNKATVGAITLPANHLATAVKVDGESGAISVSASQTVASTAIEVSGTAGAITASEADNNATIAVSGTAQAITNEGSGAVTLTGVATSISSTGTGAIEISGNPVYKETNGYKVATVETKGNVTINLNNEGVAIGTSLTFNAPAALTLTQGYIKAITVNSAKTTDVVTCTLGDEKYVTVPAVAQTKGKFVVANAPKWNGEMMGGSFDTDAGETAIKAVVGMDKYTKPTDWTATNYGDAAGAIYTPIGLAENFGGATKVELANDIDLNNKLWTAKASKEAFDGKGKTIKNLTVAVPADKADASLATDGLGLFSELKHAVSNLTLDGVTVDAKVYTTSDTKYTVSNIGALAGKTSTTAVVLTNVAVKNINLQSAGQAGTTNGAKAIGGVIGKAEIGVTMNGVVVSGTNKITGYSAMGGLIGDAAGNAVTITKATVGTTEVPTAVSGVTFKNNHNSANTENANDKDYLKVGNFIGTATGAAAIKMTDVEVAPALNMESIIKPAYTGLTQYLEEKTYYPFVFAQGLIGYCGDETLTNKPSINGKTYDMYDNKKDGTTATNNVLYYINK